MPKIVCLLLLCYSLYGCSSLPVDSEVPPELKLLPVAEGFSLPLQKQRLTLMNDDDKQEFISLLSVDSGLLKLAILMPSGQQLLYLMYDGNNLTKKNFSNVDIPAENILSVIQLVHWPETSLHEYYRPEDGWSVDIGNDVRELSSRGNMLVRASYREPDIEIENVIHNFTLVIQPLENRYP